MTHSFMDTVRDRNIPLEVRLNRIRQIARPQEKRRSFPVMIELMAGTDAELRHEAVVQLPALRDSRALFALVNLFLALDLGKDPLLAGAIIRSVGETGDPRAGDWLRELAGLSQESLATLAKEALFRCAPGREDFLYTFIGSEEDRLKAVEGSGCRAVAIPDRDALRRAHAMIEEECGYALYVVLPADPADPFNGECRLVIGPRRSEHFHAARGADVLAAGEVAFEGERAVEIDGHSGGFYPAQGSFVWARRAFESAGIPVDRSGYSRSWPPEGFFDEGVLCRFPLYELGKRPR